MRNSFWWNIQYADVVLCQCTADTLQELPSNTAVFIKLGWRKVPCPRSRQQQLWTDSTVFFIHSHPYKYKVFSESVKGKFFCLFCLCEQSQCLYFQSYIISYLIANYYKCFNHHFILLDLLRCYFIYFCNFVYEKYKAVIKIEYKAHLFNWQDKGFENKVTVMSLLFVGYIWS